TGLRARRYAFAVAPCHRTLDHEAPVPFAGLSEIGEQRRCDCIETCCAHLPMAQELQIEGLSNSFDRQPPRRPWVRVSDVRTRAS
ncbi:MAG: hypothetical protein AAFV47_15300, partial [Pseudomonadota bacterium]